MRVATALLLVIALAPQPQLKDSTVSRDGPPVMTFGPNNHAVRDPRWRYIRYSDGGEELYDEDADPNEWTNLAAKPEWAAVKEALRKWLPVVNRPMTKQSGFLPQDPALAPGKSAGPASE